MADPHYSGSASRTFYLTLALRDSTMLARYSSRGLKPSRYIFVWRSGRTVSLSRQHEALSFCCGQCLIAHAIHTGQCALSKPTARPAQRVRQNPRPCTARVAQFSSSTGQSKYAAVKDESHPSLFYHLFDDDELLHPVFSLSFLEERPASARSQTVLGWLPALSPSDSESGENGLNDFIQNESFLPILHNTVKEGLLEDDIWRNGAIQAQSGWMHIFDQRNPPPLNRIPDPDDIIASVVVEDGRMLIETYQPMPSYRLCTGDGVCQLTDTLMDRLKSTLRRVAEEERKGH